MSILLTGFEPFDGAETNPSWEAVRLVPDVLAGHAVHKLCLPVIFGDAAALALREIRRLQPALVICCGVAGGREGVTPELVAINYRQARIPDNAGQHFTGEPIAPGGETAYMTRLPVNRMVEAIRALEIPSWLSLSAGAYVCNDLYYHVLAAETALGHRGLFVHVPQAEKVNATQSAKALAACITTALETE